MVWCESYCWRVRLLGIFVTRELWLLLISLLSLLLLLKLDRHKWWDTHLSYEV